MSFFHKKSILAIDIHSNDVRIAQIEPNHTITHMQSFSLPQGVFEKDRLVKPELVSAVILEALKQFPKTSNEAVMIAPDIYCFTQVFEIPEIADQEERKTAILEKAAQGIPLNPDELYWDYDQHDKDATTGKQKIVYVGVLREIIDQYIAIAAGANLSILSIEPEVFVLSKLFLSEGPKTSTENSTNMIVTVGDTAASLTTFNHGNEFLVSSIVPFPSGYFTRSIAQSVVSQDGNDKKVPELNPDTVGTNRETVLQTALHAMTDEIKKARDYIATTFHEQLGKVILVGDPATLPNIETYFESILGIPVVIGNVGITQIKYDVSKYGPSEKYINLIGLSIEDTTAKAQEKNINLLPLKTKKHTEKTPQTVIAPTTNIPETNNKTSWVRKWGAYVFIALTFAALAFVVYSYIILPIRQHG